MSTYKYTPLCADRQEIRLITLLPGRFSDAIVIELSQESLSSPGSSVPRYEALSYSWGSAQTSATVFAREYTDVPRRPHCQHQTLSLIPATENLALALAHLRHPENSRVLWVDAICIDQQNVAERSSEVSRMKEIYTFAQKVLIWLGPDGGHGTLGVRALATIGINAVLNYNAMRSTTALGGPPDVSRSDADLSGLHEGKWFAVQGILCRPWFTRLWIWQEALLASRAIVHVGFDEISWEYFAAAIEWVDTEAIHSPHILKYIDRRVLERVRRLVRGKGFQSLFMLLFLTRESLCSDPRDRIYGVLGLLSAEEKEKWAIRPDYSTTPETIYTHIIERSLVVSPRLDFLLLCGTPGSSLNLPSWVPDLSLSQRGLRALCFDASGKSHHEASCSGGVLWVRSIDRGTVHNVSAVVPLNATLQEASAIFREWAPPDFLDTPYGPGGSMLDAYVRTVVGNQIDHHQDVSFAATLIDGKRAFLDNIWLGQDPELSVDTKIALYLELFLRCVSGRCIFSTNGGYVGVGIEATKAGDRICVALGCSSPLVIRPSSGDGKYYCLVGPSYVHGLMATEAFLGPLPESWEGKWIQFGGDARYAYYRNGVATFEDPRLGLLPPEWGLCNVDLEGEDSHDGLQDIMFENNQTGKK